MSDLLIGIDIGGTKCAVVLGNSVPEILYRVEFPTDSKAGPEQTIDKIKNAIQNILDKLGSEKVKYNLEENISIEKSNSISDVAIK